MSELKILREFKRFHLSNAHNMQVTLSNFGARVLSIKVPSKSGNLVEVTQNYENNKDIINDSAYMGAICGRVANRISDAKFKLEGRQYELENNNGNNMLHGGTRGFSNQLWKVKNQSKNRVTFSLFSKHLDQGFPGNLHIDVCYFLSNENELRLSITAHCDHICPINICNHTYFHLGETDGIGRLKLQINASHFIPVNSNGIPKGEIKPVTDEMNFQEAQTLENKLALRDFDDCYVVDKLQSANLTSLTNSIHLAVTSDQLGLQVYTGNFLPQKHSAIALEAQGLIDAINHPNIETDYVSPDMPYSKFVNYKFIVI